MPTNDRPSKPHQLPLVEAPRQDGGVRSPAPGDGVEVFGLRFKDENERREHFKQILAEKLKEPGFRDQAGFPTASDDDILGLSDPPWYTACPNPFLQQFMAQAGRPLLAGDSYSREPLAVDTEVGKTDALYKAHGYHTKVPHLAIVPSILHYTDPGDVVLDGFCGSGLMGVAAQWCGSASPTYRAGVEEERRKQGLAKPKWGARRAVLNDLSPAASFIAQGFNLPFDVAAFERVSQALLAAVDADVGWMYETKGADGKKGRINFTVWSEVFACPNCGGDIVFLEHARDPVTDAVRKKFPCPNCSAELGKKRGRSGTSDDDEATGSLRRSFQTLEDPATRGTWRRIRFEPVSINYSVGGKSFSKNPDQADRELLAKIAALPLPREVPTTRFPLESMAHGSRLAPKGFTHVHHLFLPRAAQALAALWRRASAERDPRLRAMLLWFVEQSVWGASILNRYSPTHFSQVNRALNGVYYVPSQHSECSPSYMLGGRADRIVAAFKQRYSRTGNVAISTGSVAKLGLPSDSIDYVFTDPPFGENIYYADLNFLVESWHRAVTTAKAEAIVDSGKGKSTQDYGNLMLAAFREYHRVLKPGRWLTMVFSNSHNSVWNAIQEALGEAGLVVADVRMLATGQGSYRQVTSTAVKENLIVSCYKPSERLESRLAQGKSSPDLAWDFVREHLGKIVVSIESEGAMEVVAERTTDSLYDRLVALCVQRHIPVPLSKAEFTAGLEERLPATRDGMWFLPGQVDTYDKKRMKVDAIGQIPLIITNETTAIRWLRAELSRKPQVIEDLYNPFKIHSQSWAQTEQTRELRDLLRENFLQYEEGEVPGPIHAYLSSNYHDLRNLPKDAPRLISLAASRWYVPDPNRAGDLEKRRKGQLIKEFDVYVADKRKRLDVFRREAVVVGFHEALEKGQYARIIAVADKLPPKLLEDDFDLYMLVENARTLAGS